jgi:hypothetical protein
MTVLALLPSRLLLISPWYVVHQPKSACAPHCLLVMPMMIVRWVSVAMLACGIGCYLRCFSIATLYGLQMANGFGLCRLEIS